MKERQAKICALILAAGTSSRMGTMKALLPLNDTPMLGEALRCFREAGVEDIRVVVGHKAGEIIPVAERYGLRVIFNADYELGMLSSILAGVKDFEPEVEAFFLLPVDIPLVRPETVRSLLAAHGRSHATIIYPCFQQERGHPPLIATEIVRNNPSVSYGEGLRGLLSLYELQALDVEVVDQGVLMDCDTPSEYKKVWSRASRKDIPSKRECEALWREQMVPERVKAHCRTVAELARVLAIHLNGAGLNLDVELVLSGGFLHDIAKGRPDHARTGAKILRDRGFPRVAELVSSHMNLKNHPPSVDEKTLLYLADKLVDGDRIVSLEARFSRSIEKFSGEREALDAVMRRFRMAAELKARVENILRSPLEGVIDRHERSIRAAVRSSHRGIFLVRHGAVHTGGREKRFVGQLDLPLSPQGMAEIEDLREKLRAVQFSTIYCSDLTRSLLTAQILAGPHGIRPTPRRDLREIALGEWEGLTFEDVAARFPKEFQERGRDMVHTRPPGGESFHDCACRVIPALYDIIHSSSGNVLIVGHAGVNRIILSQAMGKDLKDLFDIPQDYCAANMIHYDDFRFSLNGGAGDRD